MLRNAWKEVRQHPGRVIATLVAIAISVAFIAASSVFLETEKNGLARQLSASVNATDVVAQPDYESRESPEPAEKALATIKSDPGVAEAEQTHIGFGTLANGDKFKQVQTVNVPSEPFRYATVTEGRWAEKSGEVTLPKQIAEDLGVSVNASVEFNGQQAKVVGISDDPTTLLMEYIYVSNELFKGDSQGPGTFLVKAKPGTSPETLVSGLKGKLSGYKVDTAEDYRQQALKDLSTGIDVFKYMFAVFQFLALLVGMIIIANTFTILITQRRRQIGLLRAVGASSGQVQRQFFVEALILGLIGGLIGLVLGTGLAAIGAYFTKSIQFGLKFPLTDMLVALLIGAVITLLAAMVPILRTTRVAPLEALRPVLSADAQKRVSRVRAIICGLMLAIGIGLAVMSQVVGKDSWPLLWALGGVFFITIATLGGAPLYVAGMLRAGGKMIGGTGPTARLATQNSARNPQRAASTAVALMLAMGLIVALQVGTASVRHTVQLQIDKHYPIDLIVVQGPTHEEGKQPALSPKAQQTLKNLPNMKAKSQLTGGSATTSSGAEYTVAAADGNLEQASGITSVADGVALLPDGEAKNGDELVLKGDAGEVALKVQTRKGLAPDTVLVSETSMKRLVKDPKPVGFIYKAVDRGDLGGAYNQIQNLMISEMTSGTSTPLSIDGGALFSHTLNSILNILLGVVTALLGVAVAIALVGVANTLGLSVIERHRESALLRALGMQKKSLRLMLLIEALMLALAGTLVGLIGGTLFAVVVLRAAFRNMDLPTDYLKYTMDPWQTLALLAIACGCAALASIMPGLRAAKASPTEALAEE